MSVVARVDFHDHVGVLVERGDVFAENAEVVRRYPYRFEPRGAGERKSYTGLITRAGGTAKLIDRAGGESSSPALEHPTSTVPELDVHAKPKLTVTFRRAALNVIRDEISALGPFLLERGYETGGNLIGREHGGVVEVIDASGPEASPDDRSERRFVDAVRISATSGVEIAQELRAHSGDPTIMLRGGWHVHPIPEPQPSGADRANAVTALELLQLQYEWAAPEQWVDLIVVPDRHGRFDDPGVVGWATRFLPWRGAVTEPVRVDAP